MPARRGRAWAVAVLAAAALVVGHSAIAWAQAPGAGRRAVLGGALLWTAAPAASRAVGEKVVVLGGSGFVGSRVCERLASEGASVTSVSRSGRPPAAAGAWADKVTWVQGDATSMDLAPVFQGADAVISAIGAIGSSEDEASNGLTAERAAAAAAAARARRFVLVSATQLVAEAGVGGVFPGYVAGKRRAEAAAASFPGQTLVLHRRSSSAAPSSARAPRASRSGTASRLRTFWARASCAEWPPFLPPRSSWLCCPRTRSRMWPLLLWLGPKARRPVCCQATTRSCPPPKIGRVHV